MTEATALELPEFDPADTELHGSQFHKVMTELSAKSWLARIPLGYMTLDREAGEFFLRTKKATFPGPLIAELFGIKSGPLRDEIDHNILHIDGDDHARLRNLLNPSFTPRAADRWRPIMREILEELYASVENDHQVEFVEAFAKPYPSMTIATIMGAPRKDAPRLHQWSNWIQRQFDGPSLTRDRRRIEQACAEFYEWCGKLLAQRRDAPSDDLISMLVHEEQDGDRLNDVELVNLVLNVLVGGVDTTQSQLAHAIRLFAEFPDQWELLAREPHHAPRAVEEVLRYEPITPFTARMLSEEVTFRDVSFPAGTVIMICSFTGNRDGAGDPSFDITASRNDARLMTFGAGIHFCVGANIARAELQEALMFLAPRLRNLRLCGEPSFGTIQGIYGLDALPIEWS
ncbi:MAG: cytochrome P450 [Actinomycetota bacterium]